MDLTTIAGAIKITDAAITLTNNKNIVGKVKTFLKGTKEIVILGNSGAGKTQFIKSFDKGPISYLREKDKTLTVYSSNHIVNEYKLKIWDTPGQAIKKSQRRDLLREIIIRKQSIGLINVVCYGYNTMDLMPNGKQYSEDEIKEFVEKKRKEEIQQAEEIKTFMEFAKVKWLITLISKADLWMKEGEESVISHYRDGEYLKSIGQYKYHEIVPYCSVIQRYYGNVMPSIDEREKTEIGSNFLQILNQLLNIRS